MSFRTALTALEALRPKLVRDKCGLVLPERCLTLLRDDAFSHYGFASAAAWRRVVAARLGEAAAYPRGSQCLGLFG